MNNYDLYIGQAANGFYLLENGEITIFNSLTELLTWVEDYYLDKDENIKIEDLYLKNGCPLDERTRNVLRAQEIIYVDDLDKYSDLEFLRMDNCGKKSLLNIHKFKEWVDSYEAK